MKYPQFVIPLLLNLKKDKKASEVIADFLSFEKNMRGTPSYTQTKSKLIKSEKNKHDKKL
jgi:hypothetical protein